MRILFLLTVLANIVVAAASLWLLPNPMAVHFDLDGTANGFGPPREHALLMGGTILVLAGIFLGISYLQRILPAFCFNLPNRDYWLCEARRPETMKKIARFMDEMGVGIMAFFLLLQWEILRANRLDPPRMPPAATMTAAVVLLVFLGVVTFRLYRAFRLPKAENDETISV